MKMYCHVVAEVLGICGCVSVDFHHGSPVSAVTHTSVVASARIFDHYKTVLIVGSGWHPEPLNVGVNDVEWHFYCMMYV